MLDCCYSGAFPSGWQHKGGAKLNLERELGRKGRVILTSSSATQQSFQQDHATLSLYTQYVVQGLEQGVDPTNSAVTARTLHRYVQPKVTEQKPTMVRMASHPPFWFRDWWHVPDYNWDCHLVEFNLDSIG